MFFLKILSFSGRSRFQTCPMDFASKTSLQRGPANVSSPNTVPAQSQSSPQPSLSLTLFPLAGWHTFPLQASRRLYQFWSLPFYWLTVQKNVIFWKPTVVFPLHCTQKPKTQPMISCLFQQHLRHLFKAAHWYDGKQETPFTRSLWPSCCIIFLWPVENRISEAEDDCATF